MKEIPLTQGKVALVDDEDYERLAQYNWQAYLIRGKWYAKRRLPGKEKVTRLARMHREIIDAPINMEVDHINGNGLDNRRNNLRLATRAQNVHSMGKYGSLTGRKTSSQYKGVNYLVRNGRWYAHIAVGPKGHALGGYATEIEAALAYDDAARKYFGQFARTNF